MLRCKPNQLCVIVGAPAGCEANIGAFITTVAHEPGFFDPKTKAPLQLWTWRGASRPLIACLNTSAGGIVTRHTSDGVVRAAGRTFDMGMRDQHLIPWEPLQEPKEKNTHLPRYVFKDISVTVAKQPA